MLTPNERTSAVQAVRIRDIGYASTLFIGDLRYFAPISIVFAVQREISRYAGSEGDLSKYPIFSGPIPQLLPDEEVQMRIVNANPVIQTGSVRVTSISNSSLVQFGQLRGIRAESRVKNIREKLTGLLPKSALKISKKRTSEQTESSSIESCEANWPVFYADSLPIPEALKAEDFSVKDNPSFPD